jgi:glycosyltransferase involved in cell wall biosynthesis
MLEWTPAARRIWTSKVSLFICPTKQCYDALRKEKLPCCLFPWPIDIDRFKYAQRKKCDQFVFINGRGGWHGRKGADVICQAKKLWPEMPIVVYSQLRRAWPKDIKVLPPTRENVDLYQYGDVLLSPHTIDGLGLEPMEAAASGMPVITPDGAPWNEYPAIAKIPTKITRKHVGRMSDWHNCDAQALVRICKQLLGTDITKESAAVREWAETRSWTKHISTFTTLIQKGAP